MVPSGFLGGDISPRAVAAKSFSPHRNEKYDPVSKPIPVSSLMYFIFVQRCNHWPDEGGSSALALLGINIVSSPVLGLKFFTLNTTLLSPSVGTV